MADKKVPDDKIPIKEILAAIDTGEKGIWDELSDAQKKSVSFWLLNRYVSSVKGNMTAQAMAVFKTNEFYNKNWNVLGTKHPKLQWQLLCLLNDKKDIKFHEWIGLKSAGNSSSKSVKFLLKLYPDMKIEEVELLARISSKAELKQLAEDHGFDKKSVDL